MPLIEEVQLQRHVLLGLLHQPHEGEVGEEPMDRLQQHLQHKSIISTFSYIYSEDNDYEKNESMLQAIMKTLNIILECFERSLLRSYP